MTAGRSAHYRGNMPRYAGRRYLVHLYRLDGSSLFLHPFSERQSMVEVFESGVPIGLFGHEPPVERIRQFREHLYSIATHDARIWALDLRFLNRFFWTTLTFLTLYSTFLFFGVPGLTEVYYPVIALLVSVLVYGLLSVKDARGALAISRRTALRRNIDNIRFEFSELVVEIEELLQELDRATPEEVLHVMRRRSIDSAGIPKHTRRKPGQIERDLLFALERRLRNSGALKVRRKLQRWLNQGDGESLGALTRDVADRKVDLSLLALYWQIKERTAAVARPTRNA